MGWRGDTIFTHHSKSIERILEFRTDLAGSSMGLPESSRRRQMRFDGTNSGVAEEGFG